MTQDSEVHRSASRSRWGNPLLPVALFAVAGAIFWWGLRSQAHPAAALPRPVTPRGDLAEDEQATIELFEATSPSVVYVRPVRLAKQAYSGNLLELPAGTGSGFVWDKQGHIVTNFHVTQGAARVRVKLWDHSEYQAVRVGEAADKDLAVWKIDAPPDKLKPVAVGSSKDLRVGQKVFAIGNPFGLDFSLSTGVVSALDREIKAITGRTIGGVIQTDAAINPGNSGGPLLDSAGRLIGVNTMIFSPSGSSAGVGFAVPVDVINQIVPQLIAHGKIIRPGLGVRVFRDQLARRLGVRRGAVIREVLPGSGAAAAGLRGLGDQSGRRLGDIIVQVGKTEIRTTDDLAAALEQLQIGQQVAVTVVRNGQRITKTVRLQQVD